MWNTKENGIYTIKLKSLVDGILFHKSIDMEQICHKSMKWKVNRNYGNCQNKRMNKKSIHLLRKLYNNTITFFTPAFSAKIL